MTIYNLSKEDVRQLFKGIPIIVPAGGSMELEPDAASHLLAKQPRLSATPKTEKKDNAEDKNFGEKMAEIRKSKKRSK